MDDTDDRSDPTTAPDPTEVDPADLKRQLSDIRGAMGLEERYPGQRRLWLLNGIVVAVVALAINLLFAVPPSTRPGWLPDWLFLGVWLAFAVVIGASLLHLASRTPGDSTPATAPDWRVLTGTLLLAFASLFVLASPVIEEAVRNLTLQEESRLTGGFLYGLVIAIAGTGFLFAGNALRAHRIRKRDRWVFYGAGVWMLVYAALMPYSVRLQLYGYGLFGVLFLLYSTAAYVLLGRSSDEQ